jgi:hypothetical protein
LTKLNLLCAAVSEVLLLLAPDVPGQGEDLRFGQLLESGPFHPLPGRPLARVEVAVLLGDPRQWLVVLPVRPQQLDGLFRRTRRQSPVFEPLQQGVGPRVPFFARHDVRSQR